MLRLTSSITVLPITHTRSSSRRRAAGEVAVVGAGDASPRLDRPGRPQEGKPPLQGRLLKPPVTLLRIIIHPSLASNL